VCVLPNHTVEAEQVLEATGALTRFSHELNRRLECSLERTVRGATKLLVLHGGRALACLLTGTAYIMWATHVNRTTTGHVSHTLHRHVPLLFNLDGQGHVKALCILHEEVQRVPIRENSPALFWDLHGSVFVCERRMPQPALQRQPLLTVSEARALELVTQSGHSARAVALEANPYASSVDDEDDPLPFIDDTRLTLTPVGDAAVLE
jgi:hypothetical protein